MPYEKADPLEDQGVYRQGKEERCRALIMSATHLTNHDIRQGTANQ